MAVRTAYKAVDASWVGGTSGYHLPKTFTVGSTVVADSSSDALSYMHSYAASSGSTIIQNIADNDSGGVTHPFYYGLHLYVGSGSFSYNALSRLFAERGHDGHVVECQFDDADVIQHLTDAGGAPGVDLWRVTQCTVVSEVTS